MIDFGLPTKDLTDDYRIRFDHRRGSQWGLVYYACDVTLHALQQLCMVVVRGRTEVH